MNRREFVAVSSGLVSALIESTSVNVVNDKCEDVVIFAFNGVPSKRIYDEMAKACGLLGIKAMLVPNCDVAKLDEPQEVRGSKPSRKLIADGVMEIGFVIWANIEAGLVCRYVPEADGSLRAPLRRIVEKFDHLEWVQSRTALTL